MKRRDLMKHLHKNGCELIREGASDSWWMNTLQNRRSAVPRHNEVNEKLT
jgi:mRNA interferase HicA